MKGHIESSDSQPLKMQRPEPTYLGQLLQRQVLGQPALSQLCLYLCVVPFCQGGVQWKLMAYTHHVRRKRVEEENNQISLSPQETALEKKEPDGHVTWLGQ